MSSQGNRPANLDVSRVMEPCKMQTNPRSPQSQKVGANSERGVSFNWT